MTDTGALPATAVGQRPSGGGGRRPSSARLVRRQAGQATRGFLRTPIAAFFTLAFPLVWLSLVVLLVGNVAVPTPVGTVRMAQYLTPVAAVFAAVMASYVSLAVTVSLARERGELRRLRGTPVPPWTYVAGQVLSTVLVAAVGTVVMVVAGVLLYGVEIVRAALPAAVGTLLVGVACFATLGLVVAAVAPGSAAAQAVALGSVIVLGFVSDMFTVGGELPRWLDVIGWTLPLRHFVNALATTFDPFAGGSGWSADHLAVLVAWTVAGGLVAGRAFRWEPRRRRAGRATPVPADRETPSPVRRRSSVGLLVAQVRYADRILWRDAGSWFFALAFPVLLLVVMGLLWRGTPVAQEFVPGLMVYGAATTAFVNVPEAVARARRSGVLTRLRGTPLPSWAYVGGWLGAALWMALLAALLVLGVGVLAFGVDVAPSGLPAALGVLVLGTLTVAALGLALAAALPDPRTLSVVALAVLLPLAFVSGIFFFGGDEPAVVRAIGGVFPLQHLRDAMDEALTGGGWFPVSPHHLLVVTAWGVAGAAVTALVARRR